MITSLIEVLELPNFCHMTTSTIKLMSRDTFLLMMSKTEIMTSQPLLLNTFILGRLRVAIFPDIIKIVTMFIKRTFQD